MNVEKTYRRAIGGLAVGLAVAAVLAPGAQAETPILTPKQYAHLPSMAFPVNPAKYNPALRGMTAHVRVLTQEQYAHFPSMAFPVNPALYLTDDQYAHVPTFPTPVNPNLYLTPEQYSHLPSFPSAVDAAAYSPVAAPSNGVAWGDAGVGFAIGAVLGMLVAGAVVVVTRRRRSVAGV